MADSNRLLAANQSPFTDPSRLQSKKSSKDINAAVGQSIEFLIEMMLATAKNRLPDLDGNGSNNYLAKEISDTSIAIANATVASESTTALSNLSDRLKDSIVPQSLPFIGKTVYCDDSKRLFNGADEVQFDFDVQIPSRYTGYFAEVNVQILSENNQVVYSTTINARDGNNKFFWDGKDSARKTVKDGEYKIKLTNAKVKGNNGDVVPVEALSAFSSVVKSVLHENDEVKLVLDNGRTVNVDQVIRTDDTVDPDSTRPSGEPYVPYIGKQVTIDLSRTVVQAGKGEIKFNNTVKNPGKVIVNLSKENGESVKTINFDNVKIQEGLNTLTLNDRDIPDGKYITEVYVEDKAQDDQRIQMVNQHKTITVDGVNIGNGKLIARDSKEEYHASMIDAVSYLPPGSNPALVSGQYVGKQLVYKDINSNSIAFSGNQVDIDISIQKPPEGRQLNSAEIRIYDKDGTEVNKLHVNGNALYHNTVMNTAPRFDKLNQHSKNKVNDYIIRAFRLQGVQNYDNLTREEKLAVNKYIEEGFRNGELYKAGHEAPADKLRNMGVVRARWNGTQASGGWAQHGTYSYKVFISTTDLAGNNREDYQLPEPLLASAINTVDVKGDEIVLNLANGVNLPLGSDRIIEVRS